MEQTEEITEKKSEKTENKKFKSRKFYVWTVATIFEFAFCLLGFLTENTDLAQEFITWWGSISLVYIGGNVAQKFAFQNKNGGEK